MSETPPLPVLPLLTYSLTSSVTYRFNIYSILAFYLIMQLCKESFIKYKTFFLFMYIYFYLHSFHLKIWSSHIELLLYYIEDFVSLLNPASSA